MEYTPIRIKGEIMDVIPYARFVLLGIVLPGILLLIFNPVVGIFAEYFPPSGVYANFAMMLWAGIPILIFFVEGIRFLRQIQIQRQ